MPQYDDDINDDLDESIGDDWDEERPLWQTLVPVLAALLIGGVLGLIGGAQIFGNTAAASNVSSEACLVLASELYRQGESLTVVQEHLQALGYENAGSSLAKLADEYESSGDLRKKRISADLRQLAEALTSDARATSTPIMVAASSPQPTTTRHSPTTTPTTAPAPPTPTRKPTAPPTSTPKPTSVVKPTAVPTEAPPVPTRPPAEPTPEVRPATITSSGGEGAIVRSKPTMESTAVAYLGHGAPVEVLQVVEGQAIDETEPRWYLIRFNGQTGYVYFKLIKFGD